MKYILPTLTFVIIFLYVRFFFKRLRPLIALKKAARYAGAKLLLTTPSYWLPTNQCKHSEILVIGDHFAYSIKMIGLFQKYCDLHFWNQREYATRKYLFHWQIAQAVPLGQKATTHKELNIDFTKGLPEDFSGKVIPFYLLSPTNSPIHITKNDVNVIVDLVPGDKLDNVIFADREYLHQYIRLALHEQITTKRNFT